LNNRVERLNADRATINNAAFNGERIGNLAEDGNVSWTVNIFSNGVYRVSIEYARHQGGEVGLRMTGGDMGELTAELPGTNGQLQTLTLGYMSMLSSGSDPYPFTLTPTSFYNGEFAEFTAVILEWVDNLDLYTVVDGGTTILVHTAAELIGEIRDEGSNLGFWCAHSVASWPLSVRQEGVYRVTLYTASPNNFGGIGLITTVHDRLLMYMEVPYTGDWGNYQKIDIGTITLREGEYYFRFQGYRLNQGHFLNVRHIELELVEEPAVFPILLDEVIVPVANAALEGQLPENDWLNIGHFRPNMGVSYHLDVAEAGSYEIVLSYTSPYGSTGYLWVNGAQSNFDVEATGGWGNYVELSLGTFNLNAGINVIRFSGNPDATDGWFMNHDHIILIRQ
jgi:hypothetical protein